MMRENAAYDFFVSRRGSVAGTAREVTDVLTEKGYRVLVQDYDIAIGASFVEAMHEAIKIARDLIILYTSDYENSAYTRKEFTCFEAERAQSSEDRRIIVLRCEDVPLRGLLAGNVYQDLVGIDDAQERRRRIIAAAEGHSQAEKPPPRIFVGVPPRIASFTGRIDELGRLDAILIQERPAAIVHATVRAAVQGLGGVGKTSLAIEYANRFRDLYTGVWWCPAETRTGLLSSLAALAVALRVAPADEPDVEKAAKVGLCRLAELRTNWLLVYDNVTSPDEIIDLLPAHGARVLITSRFPDWKEWAEEVALDVLPVEEAVAFLQIRADRSDKVGAKALAEALGGLPLALNHAAAYCRRTPMEFGNYAVVASKLIAAAPRGAAYPRSVAATFDLAIAAAVAQCVAAEGLIAYLAHCAPERIPMTLVEGAIDDEGERSAALAVLMEMSLVRSASFEDGTSAVSVHRLVQTVARARATEKGTADEAIKLIVARLASVYPGAESNWQSWHRCAQLTPHIVALWEAHGKQASDSVDWPDVLNRGGGYFLSRANYVQAEALFGAALAIHKETLGIEHPRTAASLHNLAHLLVNRGDLVAARELCTQALSIREQILGPEHVDTGASLQTIALILRNLGDFAGALSANERALAICEKTLGPEHAHTATTLNVLAHLLRDMNDLDAARPLYERTLAIREKTVGPRHPDTAMSLNNLAGLLAAQGDFNAARPLYQRALGIYEATLGTDHPDIAPVLSNLGLLLRTEGDLAGAQRLLARALEIRERALGPEHPDVAGSLNNLAAVLQSQEDPLRARPLSARALQIFEKVLGNDHPNTNRVRCNLARLTGAIGQLVEAHALGEMALAAHNRRLGPDHPWTKDSARAVAEALDALGRSQEARALRDRFGLSCLLT